MAEPAQKKMSVIDPKTVKPLQKMPEDTPVLPSLHSTIGAGLLVGQGDIATVMIEKPLPEQYWWAEYDIDLEQLYFVTVEAHIQGLGFKIHPPQHRHLMNAKKISIVEFTGEDKFKTPYIIPLVVRTNTLTALEAGQS